MTTEKLDMFIVFGAFLFGAFLSAGSNPLLGLAVLIGILTTWGGVKRMPEFQKIKVKK